MLTRHGNNTKALFSKRKFHRTNGSFLSSAGPVLHLGLEIPRGRQYNITVDVAISDGSIVGILGFLARAIWN